MTYGHPKLVREHRAAVRPRSERDASDAMRQGAKVIRAKHADARPARCGCDCIDCTLKRADAEGDRSAVEFVAGFLIVAAVVCIILVVALFPRRAAAVEIFAHAGPATYERCGGLGCYDQPPLPSRWELRTQHAGIGARVGSWEFALRDLGRAAVAGEYVADADYKPAEGGSLIDPASRRVLSYSVQRSAGLSAMYAPRWDFGALGVSLSGGAMLYHQRLESIRTWADGDMEDLHERGEKLTWIVGAGLSWRLSDSLRVGYVIEQAKEVKRRNSPAGGTNSREAKPGLLLHSLRVSWVLP